MGIETSSQAAAQPRNNWIPDAVAGVSIAGLLLPEAVAYSSIANLPPQAGVIALFAGLICYGILGRSRFAIVAATSSSSAVMAAATASMAGGDMALRASLSIGLILLTGLFFWVASAAKLGGVSDFIAKPVLKGFAFGLSVVIIIKQLPKVVGYHAQGVDFPRFAYDLFTHISAWNWHGFALAALTLTLLFLLSPFRRLPGMLFVIALAIGLGRFIDLKAYGIELVGSIQLAFAVPDLPVLAHAQWLRLIELAVAMVLILYAESFSAIQTYALKHGDSASPNRDLLALGTANVLSGLFHGLPVGAGFSATTANESAGAQSRLSGAICLLVVSIIVFTLLPEIAMTPEPVLAAVVIFAVSHSLKISVFRPYFLLKRDRLVVIASVFAVLILGVLDGLLAGIALSLILMLRRWSEAGVSVLGRLNNGHDFANVANYPEAAQIANVLIVRPESPIFFANISRVLQQIQSLALARGETRAIIISMEESPDLDSTSVEALTNFAQTNGKMHRQIIFAHLKSSAREVLLRTASADLPESVLLELSVDDAVNMAMSPPKY